MLSSFIQILIFILLIVFTETVAISCVKKFHNGDGKQFFIFAVLCYALVCYFLHCSFSINNNMGITNVLWSGLSVLAVILAGVLFFHEKIHVHDIIATAMITSGIMIIKYTD